MDNLRPVLYISLAFVLFLLWDAWSDQNQPPATEISATATANNQALDVPDAPITAQTSASSESYDVPSNNGVIDDQTQFITVKTDVFDLKISTTGGDIRELNLLKYPVDSKQPENKVKFLQDTASKRFIIQSGLLSKGAAPDHHAVFGAEKSAYELSPGDEQIKVALRWQGADGVEVYKTYTFHRDSYVIDLEQTVVNGSGESWKGRQYRQLQRTSGEESDSFFIYTYTGGVIYSDSEKYEKIDFSDMSSQNLKRDVANGWVAMIQHYFVAAIIPMKGNMEHFFSKSLGYDRYLLGAVSPEQVIVAGDQATFKTELFVGPKLQGKMEELAPGLELTVDYGMLTILAKPLFILLDFIHQFVGNWGWSIVVVTLLIKLAFFPLSAKSYRSMANMRRLQPRMATLKERYADDRAGMAKATMELYKKEKINPVSGCLPMLLQIPVFIALYWVLLESVELRQADFMLWITDLSSKDPYFILPLLMGASMFVQHKLNPAPTDPMQAKLMMMMPFIFTIFFAFFPAGLVLYWVTNNLISISQQWYITRNIENEAKPNNS
ncbi:MAG: membrane protein insertase YidC [Gammaproteobacteria bacterium]|nr:membrane protein insertase YidC [Gammaproteobacteria bacterium]